MEKSEIIYGIQPVMEAMDAGKEIEKIFILKTMQPGKAGELKHAAGQLKIPFQFVPKEKLNKLTRGNHQGVVAVVSPVLYMKIEHLIPHLFESGKMPLLLVLDKITDVRNLGSIARSAECFGVDGIVLPAHGSAMVNADAVKTSAGALTRLNMVRVSNMKEAIQYLKNSGFRVIAATEKAESNYFETSFAGPVAVIMGSEEKGIAEETLQLCDDRVKIPMSGKTQSLNVAVAAGIILSEALKQRMTSKF